MVIGQGLQVLVQLGGLVVKALGRRSVKYAVRALDSAVGPGRSGFGQAVLQVNSRQKRSKLWLPKGNWGT